MFGLQEQGGNCSPAHVNPDLLSVDGAVQLSDWHRSQNPGVPSREDIVTFTCHQFHTAPGA